jgi:hypothetical protein
MMFYWQMMRMRYMISPSLQGAFSKIDYTLQTYLNHPYCPGMVRMAYNTIKSLSSGMVDAQ